MSNKNELPTKVFDDTKYEYAREHGIPNDHLPPLSSGLTTPAADFMPPDYVAKMREIKAANTTTEEQDSSSKTGRGKKALAYGGVAVIAAGGALIGHRAVGIEDNNRYSPTEQEQKALQRGIDGANQQHIETPQQLPENPSDLQIVVQPETGVKADNME